MFQIYCKRDSKSFAGLLSLIKRNEDGSVDESRSYRDIPILTGVRGKFEKSFDWVRSTGGIPEGDFLVWTTNIKQVGQLNPKLREIGEAYHVSSTDSDMLTVTNKKTGATRSAIMIHPDNDYPGSIGCIVFPNNKKGRLDFINFRNFVKDAISLGIKHIPLKVWR